MNMPLLLPAPVFYLFFFVFWGPETNGTLKINQKPNGGQDKTV